jgi:hypothetical protein
MRSAVDGALLEHRHFRLDWETSIKQESALEPEIPLFSKESFRKSIGGPHLRETKTRTRKREYNVKIRGREREISQ